MSSSFFVYIPTNGAIKANTTPTNPIVMNSKIVAFSDAIHVKHQNKGLETFVQFLKIHPLRYVMADSADFILPKHTCKFYFTCTYDDQDEFIQGTIGD